MGKSQTLDKNIKLYVIIIYRIVEVIMMGTLLISDSQIRVNLRRTANKGLLSLLSGKKLDELALKYYGVYNEGHLVGYQCPYSGRVITDFEELILEHIIPVSSNGGTVLFNCIPASIEVNGYNEKGSRHLLEWWTNSKYWDIDAPDRLVRLVNYMFEAYDIIFQKKDLVEDESFNYFEYGVDDNSKSVDLSITSKNEQQILQIQAKQTGLITYIQFLNDCIQELKKINIDTSNYEEKIAKMTNNGIFDEINKFTLYQTLLKKIIKDKVPQNNRSELTFVLNINIKNIMNSMKNYTNEQEIYKELVKRVNNLEKILSVYNIGLVSYLEDLRNLSDIDLLSKPIEVISQDDIDSLINRIRLCVADNFDKVIQWHLNNKNGSLSKGESSPPEEIILKNFVEKFYQVNTKGTTFLHTRLNYQQLKLLCESNDIRLKSLYIKILQKSIIHNIAIDYIDPNLKLKFENIYNNFGEFSDNFIDDLEIEEQKLLYSQYPEIEKSKFISLIEWYENPSNFGLSPKPGSLEKSFIHSLIGVGKRKNGYGFNIDLSSSQLKYLHDSKDIRLQMIYIKMLQNSITYNIPIKFDDVDLRKKLTDIYKIYGRFSDNFIDDLEIEEQKQLYKQHFEIEKSRFISLIEWYENPINNGKNQPTKNKDFDNYGNSLITYYNHLFEVVKSKNGYVFKNNLSIKQMEYLKNSSDIRLQMIYVARMKKAIEYSIKVGIDTQKNDSKLLDAQSVNNNFINGLPIEQQIEVYRTHSEIKPSKFILLIEWYEDEENNCKFLPSKGKDVTDSEKEIRRFYESLTATYIGKKGNSFDSSLSKEQLKYLCYSSDIRLKSIYIKILQKSLIFDIPIQYVDEKLKHQFLKIYETTGQFSDNFIDDLDVENQIYIYDNNPNLEKSLFVSLIQWYNDPQNLDKNAPKQRIDLTPEGRDLGVCLQQIRSPRKNSTGYSFGKKLSYVQLKYLCNSEDERLRNLYTDILNNAKIYNIRLFYYPDGLDIMRGVKNNVGRSI